MRTKDEFKRDAVINATVKLVNEIGFVSSSMAKIAKEADVSPATIYVYNKNKEDLLVSTYITIKKDLGQALLRDFDPALPVRDIFRKMWYNMFGYITRHRETFRFTEQFANSPYSELVDKKEVEKAFEPMFDILRRGIEQKIIKDVSFDILVAFIFYPIIILANDHLCRDFKCNDRDIDTAFTLAWDAIKL